MTRKNVEEGLDEALGWMLEGIDVIAEMALGPRADDVAACEIKLRQLLARTKLILHFIDARRPPPTTITGRMQ